ncbi:MAG: undecaprenyl-diphosphate phosphatase [Clostridia bacterium]|nr:undecaprenyl-diphosphate phosphatase [Clostridia bacterium]
MTIWESIFYGIVQGVAEFLPISSSGHLAIFQSVFGAGDPDANISFNILLHLGTLIAVFIVYWRDIVQLIRAFFSLCAKLIRGNFKLSSYSENERFVIFILIATLPLIPAALIEGYISALSSYIIVVGAVLLLNAVLLFFSDKMAKGNKTLGEVKPRNALAVGLCQLLATVPGLSRSGSTITGGLTQGFERPLAVKFSFILSIPAILGACVLKLPDFFETVAAESSEQLLIYLAGALVAALVGIAAMKLLTYISKKSNFRTFSYYCVIAGIFAIVWGITH